MVSGRRGMSPLIATVLLMAFAVALGGMIMNLSIDVSTNGDCELLSEISVEQFCADADGVRVRVRNTGEVHVQQIQLKVLTGNIEHDLNVKNSALPPNELLALSIPFTASNARVDLLGVIGSEDDPYVCTEFPIERVDPIQPC
ncbi:MAG: hypothetical protein OXR66_00825 [Candidatus Woesearchaeota archaeon]|nr:hypothetical protein [Candidatus Woesearchaeota archaeon]